MNQRKAGIILSYLQIVVQIIIGILYIPILIYFLDQEEYGLYQLLGSILVYLNLFDFGLSNTVTRYYSKYLALGDKRDQENLLALSMALYTILTVLLTIVGIILFFYLDKIFMHSLTVSELELVKRMYLIVLVNVAISIVSAIFNSIIAAHEKFLFLKSITIVQTILRPIIVLAIFSIHASALILVVIDTIFNVFNIVLKIYFSFNKLHVKIKYHYFNKNLLKEMIRYTFFVFLTAVMDQIFWRSNYLILGVLSGTAAVAVYSIALQMISLYMSLSTAISGVFLPSITKKVINNVTDKELTNIFVKIGRLQYIILGAVLIGFILYGKEFIMIWVGRNFIESYFISLIIMIPFTLDLIQNIGLSILQAKNMYGFRAVVFFIIAVINIIFAIVLTIKHGSIGAAFSTGICYFIGNGIIMNYYYYKKVQLDIFKYWKEIFKLSIPIFIVFIIGFFVDKIEIDSIIVSFLIKLLIFTLSYIIIMWNLGMKSYEKELIAKPIRKIIYLTKRKISRVLI
ncbi:oligosaccharide flippase family protein, partial [Geobacillus stearothermophilus]